LAKIPTELYIYIPRRSGKGTTFYTNIWANLTRKDTGSGIGGKWIDSYLDGTKISSLRTVSGSGYAPDAFDINPKTEGLHETWVEFQGDAEYEPCKSEEIALVCDPNLANTRIKMEVTPTDGDAPLTIKATGFIEERYVTEAGMPAGRPPAYALPLDLMVYDITSTRTMQPVKTVMSNPDGTYAIDYTFAKPGTYRVFVNFLGDAKYASAWSNNGRTTTITVTGGVLPLSFEKTVTVTAKEAKQFKWILSQTEPATPEGYERFPDLDLDFGVLGKYWCFIRSGG
jgi:hypothetical protein